MNSSELYDLLERLNACPEVKEWAKGKDLQTIWDTYPRADWMLWIVGKMVDVKGWPSRQTVVLVACDCAEAALQFVAAEENRPNDEVRIAADSAYYAAAKALYASRAAAAVLATHDAVYYASRAGVPQERLVDIVRKRIPVPYKEESK